LHSLIEVKKNDEQNYKMYRRRSGVLQIMLNRIDAAQECDHAATSVRGKRNRRLIAAPTSATKNKKGRFFNQP
jgi:hypothetical protein